MLPWPIALVATLFAIPMTWSAAALSHAWTSRTQPLLWPLVWGVMSASVVVGLSLMRPWARRLAIWASALWMVGALGSAWMAIMQSPPQPRASLLATGVASVQVLIMRYLTRPHVRRWFGVTV